MNTNNSKELNKRIMITVGVILVFITLVLSLFMHKMFSPRVMSNDELRANGAIVFENPRIVKDFDLIDHNNKAFSLNNLQDTWTLIYFGFTHCPDICPTTLADLSRVYGSLKEDIRKQTQIVLVSADPARDTPEKLAPYVTYFNPDFIGVTGEFLPIKRLAGDLNVAFNKVIIGDDYTIDHTGNIVLINPKGHYHAFFKPPFELPRLKGTYQSIVTRFDP